MRASHALRAGVYHARAGGTLRFDEAEIADPGNPLVRRWLAGEPEATSPQGVPWDVRKTGSAAIECAFVAAGLLRVARFERPNVWDVAGGLALVRAAGGTVLTRAARGWEAFDRFEAVAHSPEALADLRHWRAPLIIGQADAAALLARAETEGLAANHPFGRCSRAGFAFMPAPQKRRGTWRR